MLCNVLLSDSDSAMTDANYEGLLERLLNYKDADDIPRTNDYVPHVRREAAAAIRELRAERDAFKKSSGDYCRYGSERSEELHAVRIELEAARGLLKRMSEWDQMNPPMTGDHAWWKKQIDAALAAREAKEG